jgi:hypothetical protein
MNLDVTLDKSDSVARSWIMNGRAGELDLHFDDEDRDVDGSPLNPEKR